MSKVFQKVDSPHDSTHLDSMRRETSYIWTSPRPNCRAKASTKAAKAGYGLMHQSLAAENSVFARRPKHHPHPAANPLKTGHRRARHQFTYRHTPQDARSPRRTKCAARASCMSEDVPISKLMAGPDDYRAIDYPVFCNPAETPVTVERIRLMYSAFFSSAISSWFIRTSRRARTWAMDRAST